MTEPGWINVQAPEVELKALTLGPTDGPIALCLHGFPDTAYGWRKFGPRLAEAGWRVVAPFMRGYAPSSIPTDGSYHIGALMDDALQVRSAAGGTTRDVVIGHDWGAIAATGLVAMPDSPFAKAVIMSVPPAAAFRPLGRVPDVGRLLAKLPRQMTRSWYILYFQLPWLPERSASWVVPRLWRRWSPTYDAEEDLRHVDAAIGTPESWRPHWARTAPRSVTPARRNATPNCTDTGLLHRCCPACTYMVATMAASQPISRTGRQGSCPTAATWRSSNTPGTSCNSISRKRWPS
ncbi:alpha/beta hydrolase family protein [Mycobacterium xenopi 3993]|nr:alpha/beta hydrolase family protein [Mycobacterium xenopi 3993]